MSLITPAKRVENQGSPYLVSGNSAPVNSLWLLKCPCYVSLWQNQGPKCQLGNDGWAPDPDGNYVILTKRGKKRPDFTPFVQIFCNGEKNDVFLHRFPRLNVFIAMSFGRWCGTADVANPRPREVGGACRRQVLAGGCPKSQTFLSENRESASGLVQGIGAFRFPLIPDLSLGLGRDGVRNEMQINRDFTLTRFSP